MNFIKLFDKVFPNFPRVRTNDPVTSYEAADSVKAYANFHYKKIIDCLENAGPLGKDGIATLTNLESSQVARRLKEMKTIGLIELTGETVKSNAGRNEREWQVRDNV